MGTSPSSPVADTPLQCLLKNLGPLSLKPDIKPKLLTKFCTQDWPHYPLDNQNKWPPEGSLDPNLLRDLFNYCQRLNKWKEIPYVEAFRLLSQNPSLCTTCSPSQALLACKIASPLSSPPPSSSLDSFDPADEPPPYRAPPLNPILPEPPSSPLFPPCRLGSGTHSSYTHRSTYFLQPAAHALPWTPSGPSHFYGPIKGGSWS